MYSTYIYSKTCLIILTSGRTFGAEYIFKGDLISSPLPNARKMLAAVSHPVKGGVIAVSRGGRRDGAFPRRYDKVRQQSSTGGPFKKNLTI